MPVLIYCPEVIGGLGDAAFALKMANMLREHFQSTDVYIAYNDIPKRLGTGQEIFKKLIDAHSLYGIQLDQIGHIQEFIKKQKKFDCIVEGPISVTGNADLNKEIVSALTTDQTEVYFVPEYGVDVKPGDDRIKEYKKEGIIHATQIMTGFDEKETEGVFINSYLLKFDKNNEKDRDDAWGRMSHRMKGILTHQEEKNFLDYAQYRSLGFQYSYGRKIESFLRYVIVQSEYEVFLSQQQDKPVKDVDIVSVKEDPQEKWKWLNSDVIKQHLKECGFGSIEFVDIDEGEAKSVPLNSGDTKTPVYRVIHSQGLPHSDFISLIALSGDIVGVTGDQSLSEAISARKVIIYDKQTWKDNLAKQYREFFRKHSEDTNIVSFCSLCFECEEKTLADEEKNKDPEKIKKNIQYFSHEIRQAFLKDKDLIKKIKSGHEKIIERLNLQKKIFSQLERFFIKKKGSSAEIIKELALDHSKLGQVVAKEPAKGDELHKKEKKEEKSEKRNVTSVQDEIHLKPGHGH